MKSIVLIGELPCTLAQHLFLITVCFIVKSDSGYDYLSVEEKECLMFLEETLESLDTEADSGVSADDGETTELSKHPRTWPTRDVPKGKVCEVSK